MWCFLVFYLLIQAMAVFGLMSNNSGAIEGGQPDKVFNVAPLIAAAAIMLIAAVLFTALKKHRYIGIFVGVVSAALMLVVALELGRRFPVTIGSGDRDYGLDTWKLIWRHIGIAIIPVFMLIAWLAERAADKADAKRMEGYNKSYDLSGGAIFKDSGDSGSGEQPQRRLKRSLKKRMEKSG